MKFRFVLSVVCLSLAAAAHSKTLYVDGANGNDSTTYAANSASAPWRTLGRALWGNASRTSSNSNEAARAGDVVMVSGGPFTAPSTNERNIPAFNPVNSGTATAPIEIRAVGRVDLRTTGGNGPAMGSYMRNYIHWIGHFYIDEANSTVRADTGTTVIWDSTGVVIDGCEIQARPVTYVDNHNGIRFENARQATVRNCRINGVLGASSNPLHHNNAGMMLYYSSGVVIENNEISNTGAGVFPKGGDNSNVTIRYNKINNTRKGIRITYSHASTGENYAYQNVITNGQGDETIGIEVAENSHNWTIVNNTIYNVDNGVYLSPQVGSDLVLGGNIISNTSTAYNAWEVSLAIPAPGRNLYFNPGIWATNGRTYSSLATWLAVALGDAGSVVANPGFTNAAGGDFTVSQSSPARNLSTDVLDLDRDGSRSDTITAGAYLTGTEIIGLNTGPIPNPPTALAVQ
jgi:parallel beta-helix repeat protein